MRRASDLILATALGLLLLPVIMAVAIAVRLSLGDPVLFRQTRSGRHGAAFTILKFRTMRLPTFPYEPDAGRDTRLGRMLRAFSLDELPQLWNVLRGDMGLIGPRPTLPSQVAHYDERQRMRLEVRPGLTGWAQVNGRNSIPWSQRIELDIWYVEHRSLSLDLRIVGRTLLRLVRPNGITGTDGVNPGFPDPPAPQE